VGAAQTIFASAKGFTGLPQRKTGAVPTKSKRMRKEGGESNAKMHLVLTHNVFALRLNTAIFACFAVENRKFRATKKPTVGFLEQRLRQ